MTTKLELLKIAGQDITITPSRTQQIISNNTKYYTI